MAEATAHGPGSRRDDPLVMTERGLFCPPGGFHVDPWEPVERAVTTHALSDHAVCGSGSYLCAARGTQVLRLRVGASADVQGLQPRILKWRAEKRAADADAMVALRRLLAPLPRA